MFKKLILALFVLVPIQAEALIEVSTYVTPPIRWQILRAWSVDTGAFPCFESEANTSRFVRRSEAQPTRTIGMV